MVTEPGWYPDPLGGQGARYWDGAQWEGAIQPGPPTAPQEYPEPPPTREQTRRQWPIWLGLGLAVVVIRHGNGTTGSPEARDHL
ncbi:DUF2510 domain-containing protein, partial [Mycolicibacterium mucogenicum]|uniref:DUF2510 domain-containing protein n=1 Tax=Mycolicibacterium mucogenicum TaxID=56689 RepID=UPI001951ED50